MGWVLDEVVEAMGVRGGLGWAVPPVHLGVGGFSERLSPTFSASSPKAGPREP